MSEEQPAVTPQLRQLVEQHKHLNQTREGLRKSISESQERIRKARMPEGRLNKPGEAAEAGEALGEAPTEMVAQHRHLEQTAMGVDEALEESRQRILEERERLGTQGSESGEAAGMDASLGEQAEVRVPLAEGSEGREPGEKRLGKSRGREPFETRLGKAGLRFGQRKLSGLMGQMGVPHEIANVLSGELAHQFGDALFGKQDQPGQGGGEFGQGAEAALGESSEGATGGDLGPKLDAIIKLLEEIKGALGGTQQAPGPQADGSFVPSLGQTMNQAAGGGAAVAQAVGGQTMNQSNKGSSSDDMMQQAMAVLMRLAMSAAMAA